MNRGYRRVYFDKSTGNKLAVVAFNGYFNPTTIEEDITSFPILTERNRNTFNVIEIPFEAYRQDFEESKGNFRVNVDLFETLPDESKREALEFSYPDPNEPEEEQPYQAPLSEQINQIKVDSARSNAELFEMIIMMSGGMM